MQNVTGVILGGILGHSVCTGMAVLGGRMIAQKISVRTGKLQIILILLGHIWIFSIHIKLGQVVFVFDYQINFSIQNVI